MERDMSVAPSRGADGEAGAAPALGGGFEWGEVSLDQQLEIALESSRRIYREAVEEVGPDYIVQMVSGGDDSAAAYAVGKELGIPTTLIMHGRTGTGLPGVTQFVIDNYSADGPAFAIADAGDTYERYVLRKGFFGIGPGAHAFSYHLLKAGPFRKVRSRELRKRKRGVKILLLNGARRDESENRKKNLLERRADPGQPGDIWTNLIHHWSQDVRDHYLKTRNVTRSPIAKALCRSGECMCGTQQTLEDYVAAKLLDPAWGERMDALRAEAVRLHGFDWGQPFPKPRDANQYDLFEGFEPMCSDCNRRAA